MITSFKILESERYGEGVNYGDGLKSATMDRLGDTVVLVGKNGSGKTRLLDRLYKAAVGYVEESSPEWIDLQNRLVKAKPYGAETETIKRALNTSKEITLSSLGITGVFHFLPKDVQLGKPTAPTQTAENMAFGRSNSQMPA